MAKKKTSKKKEEVSDDELEEALFGEDLGEGAEESGLILEDDMEVEEKPKKDYRYIKATYLNKTGDVHTIRFEGVSHGFLSYLSAKLLEDKQVSYSAYKETSIDNPILSVIVDEKADIKKIIANASKNMKKEISDMKATIEKAL